MTSIGSFTKQDDGFNGTLRTLAFSVNVRIVPIPKSTENGPDYRVLAGPESRRRELPTDSWDNPVHRTSSCGPLASRLAGRAIIRRR